MSLGTFESIAESLAIIAAKMDDAPPREPATTRPSASDAGEPPAAKKQSKKSASKKTASKRAPSKAKSKGADLSDITVFKKQLFDIAEASGVDDVMVKLKAYIKSQELGSSDEVELEDRAEFLSLVKEHFAAMSEQDDDGEEDDDSLAGL